MEHEVVKKVDRPPLRTFEVAVYLDPDHQQVKYIKLQAHLVFNNEERGEGLVFRRYYDDSVRTEKVAEFQPATWAYYTEVIP